MPSSGELDRVRCGLRPVIASLGVVGRHTRRNERLKSDVPTVTAVWQATITLQPTRNVGFTAMRIVFTAYLLVIAAGLAFYIAIGIVNPQ
jgi:hypothetical protein